MSHVQKLSPEDVWFFSHNGFIKLPNVLPAEEPIFWETMTSPLVLDPLESHLGPNIEVIKNGHNHATLRRATDSGVGKLHRDMDHWSRTILTVLFYLEESTVENGCTQVIPGTHVFPDPAIPDGSWERFERQVVPMPMPVGGMLAMRGRRGMTAIKSVSIRLIALLAGLMLMTSGISAQTPITLWLDARTPEVTKWAEAF